MKMHEITESVGITSASTIATVTNPAKQKNKKRTAMHNPDGTIKNALDVDSNILGSKPVKR